MKPVYNRVESYQEGDKWTLLFWDGEQEGAKLPFYTEEDAMKYLAAYYWPANEAQFNENWERGFNWQTIGPVLDNVKSCLIVEKRQY